MGLLGDIIKSVVTNFAFGGDADRYDLFRMKRDDLRKMLTRFRAEEAKTAKILDNAGLETHFQAAYEVRPTRKDAVKNKRRLVNEIMRIERNLTEVGPEGEKLIQADQRLADWFESRGIQSTVETRRKFGDFMDEYRDSILGKIAPSEDVFEFFETFGEDANINDFINQYVDQTFANWKRGTPMLTRKEEQEYKRKRKRRRRG